jgi:glucose-1-phosphate cytidylyltransferase
LKDGLACEFREKPEDEVGWINGGFFVLEPSVLEEIDGDASVWERSPLEILTATGELASFQHDGFWQPMDTLREMRLLQELFSSGAPPWLGPPNK